MPRCEGVDVLILPGLGNSGPAHWQTLWEREHPAFRRVEQSEWDHPRCSDWAAALEDAVAACTRAPVLVAHSLACLLVVHWAAETRQTIHGALLVAPPDPAGPAFPAAAVGFAPVPTGRLPFPSILVASCNDPYGSQPCARAWAAQWGSRFIDCGAAGHINADSNLGLWNEGLELLEILSRSAA
jgi:predicted alpha/beta hydrolase family esterase